MYEPYPGYLMDLYQRAVELGDRNYVTNVLKLECCLRATLETQNQFPKEDSK